MTRREMQYLTFGYGVLSVLNALVAGYAASRGDAWVAGCFAFLAGVFGMRARWSDKPRALAFGSIGHGMVAVDEILWVTTQSALQGRERTIKSLQREIRALTGRAA